MTGRPYDGRESDAWACGVVLYALVTRRLPFDALDEARHEERYGGYAAAEPARRVRGPRRDERSERRALLMRIAKGEYAWPEPDAQEGVPEAGTALARSEGVRRVVGRLLVRDPKKRARVAQLWEDAWMRGEGAPPVPALPETAGEGETEAVAAPVETEEIDVEAWEEAVDGQGAEWEGGDFGEEGEDVDEKEEEEDEDEGVLVDEQDIGPGSVARQEHY